MSKPSAFLKHTLRLFLAVALLLAAWPQTAHAAPQASPVYVDAAGVCGGNSPCYTDIGSASLLVDDGGVIYVYAGAYGAETIASWATITLFLNDGVILDSLSLSFGAVVLQGNMKILGDFEIDPLGQFQIGSGSVEVGGRLWNRGFFDANGSPLSVRDNIYMGENFLAHNSPMRLGGDILGIPSTETNLNGSHLYLTGAYGQLLESSGFLTLPLYHLSVGSELAGYWKFDEGSGTTVTDWSGRDYHGTFVNTPTFTSAAPSLKRENPYALALNGGGVRFPLASRDTEEVGLAAWVKWNGATGSGQTLFYNGNSATNGYGLYVNNSGALLGLCGGVDVIIPNPPVQLTPGVWQHVVLERSMGVWRLFINATNVVLANNPSALPPTGSTTIGVNTSGGDPFNGAIDEAFIMERTISYLPEIANLSQGYAPTVNNVVTLSSQDFSPKSLTLNGDLTLGSGILDVTAANYPLFVHGNLIRLEGNLAKRANLIYLNGSGTQAVRAPGILFKDMVFGEGLVGFWRLDEGSGTQALDGSGFNNTGAASGGPAYSTDTFGAMFFPSSHSLRLDGVDDQVAIPDGPQFHTNAYTLSFAFKKGNPASTDVQFLVGKGLGNFEVHLSPDSTANSLRFIPAGYPASSVDAPNAFTADSWTLVTATYADGVASLYVNGELKASRSGIVGANNLTTDTSPLYLGVRSDGGYHFNGLLDDVRLYDRALTAAEVRTLAMFHTPSTNSVYLDAPLDLQGSLTISKLSTLTASANASRLSVTGNYTQHGAGNTPGLPLLLGDTNSRRLNGTHLSLGSLALNGGQIGHWAFDEGSGTSATDSSGYGGTGYLNGSLAYTGNRPSLQFTNASALHLDGSDDYVTIYDALRYHTNTFSISLWFRWDDWNTANIQFLTAKGMENFELHTGGSSVNNLRFIPAGGTATAVDAPGSIRSGWNHVVAMYMPGTAFLFVNGSLVGVRPITGGNDLSLDEQPLRLGRRSDGNYAFKGDIDDVRLYDYMLSPAQVTALYSGGLPSSPGTVTLGNPLTLAADLSLNHGNLDTGNNHAITVGGNFNSRGGQFIPQSGTLNFTAGSSHTLALEAATSFYNLVVGTGATLVETPETDHATLNGTLTNLGVIRKTKAASAGVPVSYGLTGVILQATTLGSLGAVTVERRDQNHPFATSGIQTGRYWSLSSTAPEDWTVTLTLPTTFTPDSQDKVCRYTGSGQVWDCAYTSHTATSLTRAGVQHFSDWAAGNNVTPTNISLQALSARGGTSLSWAGLLGILVLCCLGIYRRGILAKFTGRISPHEG